MNRLIGTNPNQTSTNADLGTAAFTDAKDYLTKRGSSLSKIESTIFKTAVDVFIYDTRLDSDGGAWRYRTQEKSWYNEPLNTETRGARREFPIVALILAESNKVTIYDADDSSLPMWMVFETSSGSILRAAAITKARMKNAEMWVGHGSGGGLHWVNFLKDTGRWITSSTSYGGYFQKETIDKRNLSGANYYNNVADSSDIVIASSDINDIEIVVPPNQPIDSLTGLPVPRVAVGTSTRASIILDDKRIHNSAYSGSVANVKFDNDYNLYLTRQSYNANLVYATEADYLAGTDFGDTISGQVRMLAGATNHNAFDISKSNTLHLVNATISSGDSKPGYMLHQPNTSDFTKGMSAFITSSYNTGWMTGDVTTVLAPSKRESSITGEQLLSNTTFSGASGTTPPTGWESDGITQFSLSGDELTITRNGGLGVIEQQLNDLRVGQTYVATVYVVSTQVQDARLEIQSPYVASFTDNTDNTLYTLTFVATATSHKVRIQAANSTSAVITVKTPNFRIAEPDRSLYNNGFQINGTIHKTEARAGTELRAYSGFNAGGVTVVQRNNPDTVSTFAGDFCIMGWTNTIAGNQCLLSYQNYTAGNGLVLAPNYNSDPQFRVFAGRGAQNTAVNIGEIPIGSYYFFVFYIDRTNGRIYGGINGNLRRVTNTINAFYTFSTDNELWLGSQGIITGGNYSGSVTLLRISKTLPTSEQVLKTYLEEKALFQNDAKCTMYGNVDAGLKLAEDKSTGLVHIGSNAGHAAFQNLVRVYESNDPFGTSISAVNGMVVGE